MAVATRSLDNLRELCTQLGILDKVVPTGRSKQSASGLKILKKDYILALRDYYLAIDFPTGNIPKHLQLMLGLESPMLCNRMQNMKEHQVTEIWQSPKWKFEEKMDGVRMLIVFVRGEGIHFYSRNTSVQNYRCVEYKNIWMPGFNVKVLDDLYDSFILDTEVICPNPNISTVIGNRGVKTETMLAAVTALLGLNDSDSLMVQQRENCQLRFCAFDVLYVNGSWFTSDKTTRKTQRERDPFTSDIAKAVQLAGIDCIRLSEVSDPALKKPYYDMIINNRGEGVIAKNLDGLYYAIDNRTCVPWVKLKRTMSNSLTATPLNDCVDCFVTGFERGDKGKQYENYVGKLKFSVFLTKADGTQTIHEIAHIGSFTFAERKEMTVYDPATDTVSLKPEYYGRVIEADGQNISSREQRIRQAKVIRWRPDKDKYQCVMTEEELKSMIF